MIEKNDGVLKLKSKNKTDKDK